MIKRLLKACLGWDRKSEREKYLHKYRITSRIGRCVAWLPIPLPILLQRFGSDKQQPGWHSYGATYAAVFRRFRYRPVKMLEIGIGGYEDALGGRSMLAWEAYFPFGRIVVADIVPKQLLQGGRRVVRQLDQSSAADLAAICRDEGPFDIIIDDGSHFNAHQVYSFQHLWSSLKDGGIYVVEDVQTSFWPGDVAGVAWDGAHIDQPSFRSTCYGYFLELAKYVNHAEFLEAAAVDQTLLAVGKDVIRITFEHNLIILWKGANREVSTFVGRNPGSATRAD